MSSLSNIVSVVITAQSETVSRTGFGTPLLMSQEATTVQTATVVSYASVDEMTDAGFSADGRAVADATRLFAQQPSPLALKVGKRTAQTKVITLTPVVKTLRAYSVTINGTAFTFTSDADASASEIVAGLLALINAGSEPVTASGTTTLVLTSDTAGLDFTLTGIDRTLFTQQDTSTDAGIVADMATIRTAIDGSDDWYMVYIDSNDKESIVALSTSSHIATNINKAFMWSSQDSDSLTGVSGSTLGTLKLASAPRTKGVYHTEAGAYAPHIGVSSQILSADPGSTSYQYKTLLGVPVDTLTSAEVTNVLAQNGMVYTAIAGRSVTQGPKDSLGEDMENQRFIAFLTARMQENVFGSMAARPKIPYTEDGLNIVQNAMNQTLQLGVRVGGLAATPAPKITMPVFSTISSTDKQNNELTGVKFTATLAGALYYVRGIQGTLFY